MAEQRTPRGRKKKADVIDVGDAPARESTEADADDGDDEDHEEGEEGLDADLAAAAEVEVVADEDFEDIPEPKVSSREGSLARRDPLAA